MDIATKFTAQRKLSLQSVFLIVNILVWYTSAVNVLQVVISSSGAQQFLLWSLHFSALAFSLFVGALFAKKIRRNKLFLVWTLLGIISPLLLFTVSAGGLFNLGLVTILFGVSLGLGMPSCMSHFTSLTETKNRGHYGGLIVLLTGIGSILLAVLSSTAAIAAALLILCRVLSLPLLFVPNFIKEEPTNKPQVSFVSMFKEKAFVLYLVPWLMFSLVGHLSVPVQETVLTQESIRYLMLIESVIGGVFSLIAGLLIDFTGRKRIAILAFVLVGIEFSVLGMYPNSMISWLIYTALDGIAWGAFYVVFVTSVWGDLGQGTSADKYYAIGVLPFFISKYISLVMANDIVTAVPVTALFSFTAFFLFLAVLPLVYAPETLPEKTMKDRDLKNYFEKAQRLARKEEMKKQKKEENKRHTEEKEEEDNKEYENAKTLAEKYY